MSGGCSACLGRVGGGGRVRLMGGGGGGRSAVALRLSAGDTCAGGCVFFAGNSARGATSDEVTPSKPSTPNSRRYEAASATSSASDFRISCAFSSIGNETHYATAGTDCRSVLKYT